MNREKTKNSPADFWVFVLHTFNQKNMQYAIIKPQELSKKLDALRPNVKSIQTYLWVTKRQECWETRGLRKKETNLIVDGSYNGKDRDSRNFTEFLNNWKPIIKKLT